METAYSRAISRLSTYAEFLGRVDGILQAMDEGWILPEAAITRISWVLAEAKSNLEEEDVV